MKRVIENVAVGIASAFVVWLLDHPGRGQSAMRSTASDVGQFGVGLRTPVLTVAAVVTALAVVLLVRGWRRQTLVSGSFWEFELHMPSVPTTLLGTGTALLLVWTGFVVCSHGRVWGLAPMAAAAWMCLRSIDRLRRGWSLQAGLL